MAVRHEGPGHLHTAGLTRRLGPQPGDMTSFGHRRSLLGHPIGPPRDWAPLTVGLPDTPRACPDPERGCHVPHARAATGVGALCAPGTAVLIPTEATSRQAPAASQRPVPTPPRYFPSTRIVLNEASTKGSHVFARPVFPSPVAARMERAALGLHPRASHPADQESDDARRGGDRPSSTDLELLAQLTLVDLQSGSSLVACDLASHVAKDSPGAGGLVTPKRSSPRRRSDYERDRQRR